uniref:Uncharacterized protein n=1 Tax=Molossus molossus TaxID=27622 RepID=A0A7J8DPL3_MOLMO|nr:hypothetical protein HJG59_009206 [Molossus molossus]
MPTASGQAAAGCRAVSSALCPLCERRRQCRRCGRCLHAGHPSAQDAPSRLLSRPRALLGELLLVLPCPPEPPVCKKVDAHLVMYHVLCSVSRNSFSGVFKEKCWLLPCVSLARSPCAPGFHPSERRTPAFGHWLRISYCLTSVVAGVQVTFNCPGLILTSSQRRVKRSISLRGVLPARCHTPSAAEAAPPPSFVWSFAHGAAVEVAGLCWGTAERPMLMVGTVRSGRCFSCGPGSCPLLGHGVLSRPCSAHFSIFHQLGLWKIYYKA